MFRKEICTTENYWTPPPVLSILAHLSNELVKCIEDLCQKRDEVSKEIKVDEAEKDKLEHDIAILHERLQKVNSQLAKKIQVREEYGKYFSNKSVTGTID